MKTRNAVMPMLAGVAIVDYRDDPGRMFPRGNASCRPKSAAEAPVPIVPVARVDARQYCEHDVLTAEFQPFQEVDVMAKVAGYVRIIHVDLGDRVREGQVLAELEDPGDDQRSLQGRGDGGTDGIRDSRGAR